MKNVRYKAILADLDGTVNRGAILLDGVSETYKNLDLLGIKWVFLSNNATVLDSDLCQRIQSWGLPIELGQVINSASVLLNHIRKHVGGINLMVVGQQSLVEGCFNAGATITEDPKKTDAVVVALDRNFTYDKMKRAHKAIQAGALFWATNLDVTFPDEENFSPGAGSVVAAIATAAGIQPQRVFGKPSPDMAEMALSRVAAARSECLVVGDRIDTDIMCAKNANMDCALVLTGATTRQMIEDGSIKPDYIMDDISGLLELCLQCV